MSSKEIKLDIASFSEADLRLEQSCSGLMGVSWSPTDISSSMSKAMPAFEACIQDLMDAFRRYSEMFERDCENIYKSVSSVKDVDFLLAKNFAADRGELLDERHAADIEQARKDKIKEFGEEVGKDFSKAREEQSKVEQSSHLKQVPLA